MTQDINIATSNKEASKFTIAEISILIISEDAIGVAIIAYVIAKIMAFFDKKVPEENLQHTKLDKYFRLGPYYIIWILIISIFISYFIFGIPSKKFVLIYGFAFIAFVLLLIDKSNKIRKERITDVLFVPASILVVFLTTAFCSGYSSGKFPNQNFPIATIKIANKTTRVRIIRMIESGILSLDKKPKRVVLYPWKNIIRVDIKGITPARSKK